MNRAPALILDEESGVWHRPDPLTLPRMAGETARCGEVFRAVAVAFAETRHTALFCYDCERAFEGPGRPDERDRGDDGYARTRLR
jgi:hypothetical protein